MDLRSALRSLGSVTGVMVIIGVVACVGNIAVLLTPAIGPWLGLVVSLCMVAVVMVFAFS